MTTVALSLVLAAAGAHATWNLLMKRAGASGPLFLWLGGVASVVVWAPLAVAALPTNRAGLGATAVAAAVSGALHLGYFTLLQAGYRVGDLSLVYPLARGTGPAVAVVAAIALRGERPSGVALAGAAAVVAGVLALAERRTSGAATAATFAIGTGLFIASYTLWDKRAVDDLGVSPLVLSWGTDLVRAALLTPLAFRRRAGLAAAWRRHRNGALGFAVLSPLAYVLVLAALATGDVAHVAPAREVSIVVGVVLARGVLGERVGPRRAAASALVAGGVVLIAAG